MDTFVYNKFMASLEERIEKIEQRNRNVESDKDWETSLTRKVFIVIFTYVSIGVYLNFIKVENHG